MYHKLRSKRIVIIPALILCFLFTSCDSGQEKGGNGAIAGTWEMTRIAAGNEEISAADYMKSADVKQVPVLCFESDGKVTLDVEGVSGSGTWLEQNGQYTITYTSGGKDVTKQISFDNDTLVMEQNGYTLTYERK